MLIIGINFYNIISIYVFQLSKYRKEQEDIRKQQEEEKRLELEELQKQLREQAIIDQERYCSVNE